MTSPRLWAMLGAALIMGAALLPACDGSDGEPVRVPDGFTVRKYATGLRLPAAMTFDDRGRLFVAEVGAGRVSVLPDDNGDGIADARVTFAEALNVPVGLAFGPEGRLYVSSRGQVGYLVDRDGDDASDYMVGIVLDLPNGIHQNNGIAFGPDGKLYITNGSTCNVCQDEDWRSAVILRSNFNGGNLEVFASGLRNPYDLAFGPDGQLWATDNGPDPPTVVGAPDELNRIVEGGNYGWPECFGRSIELEDGACAESLSPAVEFDPHSSSDGIVYFDQESFPTKYRGGLFVAQWGNNEGRPESGHKVVWVPAASGDLSSAQLGGESLKAEVFASGFSHPLDVAVGPDGDLFVADYGRGAIYQISWGETGSR